MPEGTEVPKQGEADDKGVPWSNRFKELERKSQERLEKMEREMEQYKAALSEQSNAGSRNANGTSGEDAARTKLAEFVKDPDAYVERAYEQVQVKRELRQLKPWLQSQQGYRDEDNARLMAIEAEYQLAHPSPLDRTKAAWDILQKEKRLAKFSSSNDDERREQSVKDTSTEGTGKSTPKQAPITRADIIKQLAKAEATGDLDESIKLLNKLEDYR